MKKGYVYILANKYRNVLYIGVTSDLYTRVFEHKEKLAKNSFTSRYNITDLVYYEEHENIQDAIDRETQLKNWKRAWKMELIRKTNPDMRRLEHEL